MDASDLFNSENKFFSFMSKLWDLLVLNFYFLLTVIIGIGPACTALYYAVVKNIRRSRGYATTEYFHSFRVNLKQGAIVGIIQFLLGFGLIYCYFFCQSMNPDSKVTQVYFTLLFVFAFLYLAISIYLFPLLSRLNLTNRQLYKMSLVLALRNLPVTLSLIILIVGSVVLTVLTLIPIFFAPAVYTWISSLMIERILKKYMPKPAEGEESTVDAWYLE